MACPFTTSVIFQSRTGSTGHLACPIENGHLHSYHIFQSRTGSTGHLAWVEAWGGNDGRPLSIPNGLHRPFSPVITAYMDGLQVFFQSRTGSTGHLAPGSHIDIGGDRTLSIPNG